MQLIPAPIPAHAVRDTVAAVFRAPAYDRSLRETLWDRVTAWVGDRLGELFDATRHSAPMRWTMVAVLLFAVGALVARMILIRRVAGARISAPDGRPRASESRDSWAAAEALAARGEFTDAAHALYRALLEAVSRSERLRLHPAKTVGDYARELRQRGSSLRQRFRDFAASYESVVYGLGHCDRARYDHLRALAAPIVDAAG